jgi:hypothetical protein
VLHWEYVGRWWDVDALCLLYAPVISFVVEFLKRVPFLARFPSLVALFISLAVGWLNVHPSPGQALPISQLVVCVLTAYAGAIATHEVVSEGTGLDHVLSGKPGA